MSAFYVGQRVRIVRTFNSPFLMGAECCITAWRDDAKSDDRAMYSGWELSVKNIHGLAVVAKSEWIEPILLSGLEPAELTVEELLPFVRETVHA